MAIEIQSMSIPDVKLITPTRFADDRGFFSEVFRRCDFSEIGRDIDFVQDNHSFSKDRGVLRGLHFQASPFAQAKLMRVVRGRILDVAVDIRRSSPSYGRHVSIELSAENWRQLFIPIGFAHGFLTLEPDTEVTYKVSDYYAREHDRGIIWNDADLGIAWPLNGRSPQLSDKDKTLPSFRNLDAYFG